MHRKIAAVLASAVLATLALAAPASAFSMGNNPDECTSAAGGSYQTYWSMIATENENLGGDWDLTCINSDGNWANDYAGYDDMVHMGNKASSIWLKVHPDGWDLYGSDTHICVRLWPGDDWTGSPTANLEGFRIYQENESDPSWNWRTLDTMLHKEGQTATGKIAWFSFPFWPTLNDDIESSRVGIYDDYNATDGHISCDEYFYWF